MVSIGLVELQTAEILGLIICFAIHFLCVTLNNTPKPRRPGVRCTTSALVCTSCTRGVQENGSIGLVVLQTAEILGLWCTSELCNRFGRTPNCGDSRINHMFRITFPMPDNSIIPLSLGDKG